MSCIAGLLAAGLAVTARAMPGDADFPRPARAIVQRSVAAPPPAANALLRRHALADLPAAHVAHDDGAGSRRGHA